jgi:HK97 family phage portal protein
MSTLQQYRVVDATPRSWPGRMLESIRSYWKGPYTLASITSSLWGDAPSTTTGLSVSEQTALTYSAFWACVNAISTDVASLPLIHYKRTGGGKERYTDSRLYRLLHDEPNPEMTSFTLRQTMQAHALTWGGGYAEIERDQQRRPLALWPITPDRVAVLRNPGGDLVYKVTNPKSEPDFLPAEDVLHIPGLGFNGMTGYSVVGMARESIGLGLAAERFGGTFFGNGATFGGVISYKGPRPPEPSEKNLTEVLSAKHQGVEKAHKFLALYNDATYTRTGIPPNDAQFLETRLHQVEEMCRWFRMPPHKIQHLLRSTNNNIEHQGIEYYTDTLRPWLVRWEQEINRKLIAAPERRIQFAEHLIDGVLRGDLPSRYSAYAVGRNWGWLSADDVRERENMNPLPNGTGKIYLVPMNMTPADRINEIIDKQVAPDPKPVVAEPAPAAEPTDDAATKANARAEAAEATAVEARAVAEQEREARLAAEATGTATAAELEQLRASETAAAAQAAQVTQLADELRTQLAAETEAHAAADTAAETARQAGADRDAGMIAAHRALIVDAMGRMIRRETEKARRAQATPEKLRQWIETFYPIHADICQAALLPAVRTHLAWQASTEDPAAVTAAFVAAHIAESIRQVRLVLESDGEDYAQTFETTLRRWELDRADAVADVILQREIDHVRHQR